MNEVLLCKLQQKVSTQSNVEIDVALSGFGLSDMQIECLIKKFDGLFLILLVPPANNCLQIRMIRCFLMILTDLNKEFKLLPCILKLVLLNLTINHSIQWSLICLIK